MSNYQIKLMESARIPTRWGEFQLCLYKNNHDDKEHLAIVMGNIHEKSNILTRLHSECFTGDVLGSLRCDCGEQLERAMKKIAEEGTGVIVYLRQEGRGIGLLAKLRAYNLQDLGYDTVDANLKLGHGADERDYTPAALILRDLGVRSVRLMTNNPQKVDALNELNVPVVERVPIQPTVHKHNQHYLDVKARRMNHMLDLPDLAIAMANGNGNGKH
jgi:3,4-dihydroxy 2-butanone 4-phosphate synthase/GTP cyclohydrolase II